ncbi:uncharacterized protein LOC120706883 isoform X2 [Panicum virgatum]|uniref:uncharacterized protein LOC120706883 isoform X2 n=1 Tax=Panicum virgatum TaxID=38727 RepID=UPI0019D50468|nr:uncharacterized protein LOC120706883 isoform X2 [Panicum virgatum]
MLPSPLQDPPTTRSGQRRGRPPSRMPLHLSSSPRASRLLDGILEARERPEDDDVGVEVDAAPAWRRRRHRPPDPDPARREGRRRPRPSPEVEEEEESGARASRRRRSTTPCSSTRPPPTTSCSPSLSVRKAYAISELKMMLILLFQKSIQAWLLVEGDSEGSAARQQSSGELWKEEKTKEWHIRATSKQARLSL